MRCYMSKNCRYHSSQHDKIPSIELGLDHCPEIAVKRIESGYESLDATSSIWSSRDDGGGNRLSIQHTTHRCFKSSFKLILICLDNSDVQHIPEGEDLSKNHCVNIDYCCRNLPPVLARHNLHSKVCWIALLASVTVLVLLFSVSFCCIPFWISLITGEGDRLVVAGEVHVSARV